MLRKAKASLPFGDTRDFEEQKKGLIAPMKELQIKADAGNVAWDMEQFQFLDQQDEFDSIHPSLHRIGQAEQQLRALRGDPGHLPGARLRPRPDDLRARQDGLDRLRLARHRRDDAGGVEAVPGARRQRACRSRRSSTRTRTATTGAACAASSTRRTSARARSRSSRRATSWSYTVSENVYAGNAMNRRLFYQYGVLLPVNPYGYVSQGLGQRRRAGPSD